MSANVPPAFHRRLGRSCMWCGGDEWIGLEDFWTDHNFQMAACCDLRLDELHEAMAEDPDEAAAVLVGLGIRSIAGADLRRVAYTDDGAGPVLLDFQLQIGPIDREPAMDFIERHHQHVGRLRCDRFRAGIWNGSTMLGVVVVGNTCARAYNGRGWLEVRRLCLRRDVDPALRWKACSALYTWAAEEAERRGWLKVITYTLESEAGMTLRYARWKREGAASRAGHTWNNATRVRAHAMPGEAKVRWSRMLHPTPEAVAAREATEAARARRNARHGAQSVMEFQAAA